MTSLNLKTVTLTIPKSDDNNCPHFRRYLDEMSKEVNMTNIAAHCDMITDIRGEIASDDDIHLAPIDSVHTAIDVLRDATMRDFTTDTDETNLLIDQALAYLVEAKMLIRVATDTPNISHNGNQEVWNG